MPVATSTLAARPRRSSSAAARARHGRAARVRRGRAARRRASPRSTCCASTPSSSREFARAGWATRRCARATRSGSGRGRPTRSRRGGTRRSTSSTRSGSTRRYVAENLARATDVDVPVVVVPLPVTSPTRTARRVPFELPDGFVFLFAFDFFSTLERKNPLGLIEAFKRAFEPGEGPTLLLKTINAQLPPRGARAAAPRDRRPRRHPARRRDARARRDGRAVRSAPTATSRCTAPRATG